MWRAGACIRFRMQVPGWRVEGELIQFAVVSSFCGETLIFSRLENYLGIGIDTALPAPRSAIQIVSPAGSTPVGVLSPSLSTVTLALSPFMVRAEILPLAFSAS